MPKLLRLLVVAALLVGACAANGADTDGAAVDGAAADGAAAVGDAAVGDAAADGGSSDDVGADGAGSEDESGDSGVGELDVDETLALDVGDGGASVDAFVPAQPPAEPVGRPGYTRYVYTRAGDAVIPALVEGPRVDQVRCQVVELPCSFGDLQALLASGEAVPAALGLEADELQQLVGELTAVQNSLAAYADANAACAAGYRPDRKQTPNMGSHFTNNALIDGVFDPGEPEILLYARSDGAEPEGALGRCRGGVWDGVDVEIVGAAYYQPFYFVGTDHLPGFTGDLDNWHVHYNLCRLDGRDVTVEPATCGPGTPDGPSDQPRGDASEGWMIHAWADDRFDNQLGVFSMWNPTLWPVADPSAVKDRGSLSGTTDEANVIVDFTLPDITVTEPGVLSFFNADGETHTVTAGTPTEPSPEFDSGLIAGRDGREISIDAPGTYSYFCEVHPTMQGTITVEGS